jgi:DNA-binding transcriptional regulator YdaS (Cro superfamily)
LRAGIRHVTLRGVQKGWKAKGLIRPLWHRVGSRERLSELTGINTATLSGMNSGRLNLGPANAATLAAALDVTPEDLGRPPGWADDEEILGIRLEELATKLAVADEKQAALTRRVTALQARVRKLEAQRAPASDATKRPQKRTSR